jgi:hypothetical protein
MFKNWSSQSPKEQNELFRRFLENAISSHESMNYDVFYEFLPNIYFRVFLNESTGFRYMTLTEISELGNILVMRKDTAFDGANLTETHIRDIYTVYQTPVVSERSGKAMSFVYNLFKSKKCKIEVITTTHNWYFNVHTKEISSPQAEINMKRRGMHSAFVFDSAHLCAFTGLYLEVAFNTTHKIVEFYLLNKERIKKSIRAKSAYEEFFHETRQFFYGFHQSDSFKLKNVQTSFDYLKKSLDNVNSANGTNFMLSSGDFPGWMSEKITF